MFSETNLFDCIINLTQSKKLVKQKWKKADMHVHSFCSHDVIPIPEHHPENIYQKALGKGLDYITITDHNTMDAYDLIGWEREHLVTGVEMTLMDPKRVGHTIHVNVYDLNKSQFYELLSTAQKDQNLEKFSNYSGPISIYCVFTERVY